MIKKQKKTKANDTPRRRAAPSPLQEGMPGEMPADLRRSAAVILREQAEESIVRRPATLFIP